MIHYLVKESTSHCSWYEAIFILYLFNICNFLDSKKDLPERWFEILSGAYSPPEDDSGATSV